MRVIILVLYLPIAAVCQLKTSIMNERTHDNPKLWLDNSIKTALEIMKGILSGPLKEKSVTLLIEKHTDAGNHITNSVMGDIRTPPVTLLRLPHNYSEDLNVKEPLEDGVQIGLDNGTHNEPSDEFGIYSETGSLVLITTSEDELWWPFHSQSIFAKDVIVISIWTLCLTKNFFATPLLSRISFAVLICPSRSQVFNDTQILFRLWTWRPYAQGNQFINLGLWDRDSFTSWNNIFINRFDDMTNKNMLILVNPYGAPFVTRAADGSVAGVSYKIIDALSSVLHFKLTIDPSNFYSWNFMREKLQRGESDLFVNAILMTAKYHEEYDLLLPYFRESFGIMLKIPPPLPRWKNIIYPFSWTVWAAVVFSMICTSVVYHALKYRHGMSFVSNALDVLQFMLSNAMAFVPKEWRIRLFLIVYWIASSFIHMSYTCNLIAVLTIPVFPKWLETAEELGNSNIRLCMLDYGSPLPERLRTSTNRVLSKLGTAMDMTFTNFSLELAGHEYCEEAVLKGTHAHIEGNAFINLMYKSRSHTAQVYPLKEQLFPSYNVFLAKKYTPWSYIIDENMQRMIESGLIHKWYDEEMKSTEQFGTRTSGEPQPLSLDHLQGSFYLMIGGTIISVLTLAKEVLEAFYFSSELNQLS